jgi:hypothetical protein
MAEQNVLSMVELASAALAAEVSAASRTEDFDSENTEENSPQIDFEGRSDPVRTLPRTIPPRRFFRTYWRSVTLRLLKHEAMESSR